MYIYIYRTSYRSLITPGAPPCVIGTDSMAILRPQIWPAAGNPVSKWASICMGKSLN